MKTLVLLAACLMLGGCAKGTFKLPDGTECTGQYMIQNCGANVICDDGRSFKCLQNLQVKSHD